MMKSFLLTTALTVSILGSGVGVAAADKDAKEKIEKAQPQVAGIDYSHFDKAVRPQDDFYQFTNGSWLKKTKINQKKYADAKGRAMTNFREAPNYIRDMIKEIVSQEKQAPGSFDEKIANMYKSHLDLDTIEKAGLSHIKQELAAIDKISSKAGLISYMIASIPKGNSTVFKFEIGDDFKDVRRNSVVLDNGFVNVNRFDYSSFAGAKGKRKRALEIYQRYVQIYFENMGFSKAKKRAQKMIELEMKLDEIKARPDYREAKDNPKYWFKFYHPYTVAELNKLAPSINWQAALEGAGMAGTDSVVVQDPSYFSGLDRLIEKEKLDVWKDFLKFYAVDHYSSYLPKAYKNAWYQAEAEHDKKKDTEKKLPSSSYRRKLAIDFANSKLSSLVSQKYLEKNFTEESKKRLTKVAESIRAEAITLFSGMTWMSEESKKRVVTKLENMVFNIGYTDVWTDLSSVEIKADDLLGNVMRLNQFWYQQSLKNLNQPVDRTKWSWPTHYANAFYRHRKNRLTVSAAFLQPKLYDPKMDDVELYGSMGTVIGHEITHALIGDADQFDAYGNFGDLWTEADKKKLTAELDKIVALYSSFELNGKGSEIFIRGDATLNENIADLIGLKLAFKALETKHKAAPLPDVNGYSWPKQFMMSYSQTWQEKRQGSSAGMQVMQDEHAPAKFRVNGVLMNLPEFYTYFGVKKGDGLYLDPAKRTTIWN